MTAGGAGGIIAIDWAASVAIRRTSELGWAIVLVPSSSKNADEFQSNRAKDKGILSLLNPETTESVAGGVMPANGIHLGMF